jgi:TonB family protein
VLLEASILFWIAAQPAADPPATGTVVPPALVTFVPATYPPEIQDGRTATVTLALEIQVDGTIGNVEVTESGGPEFDREAIAAGKQLVFSPATIDGQPVAVRILYRYTFSVREEPPPQPSINLEGIVLMGETGEPMPDVEVEIVDLATSTVTQSSTVTGAGGRFAFREVPPGHHELRFSGPGLVTVTIEQAVAPGEAADMKIAMERIDDAGEVDEEEVVRAPRVRRAIAQTRIAAAEGRRVPGTQGDTVKVVETMGGVGRAAAGSGELVVWGASPSDTRSYVDGVQVPRLFHLGGSRSVIGADLVSAVDLVPGGFAAEYGRAVGGLIRVETGKPGQASGFHGFLAADLIDASAGVKSSFGEGWSVTAGARKSLLDRTFGAFADDRARELIPIPSYWDYQAKLTNTLTAGTDVSLMVFGSEDSVTRQTPSNDPLSRSSEETRFGFHRVAARLDRLLPDGSSYDVVVWAGVDRNERIASFGGVPAGLEQTAWRTALRGGERRRLASFLTLRSGIDLEGSHSLLEKSGALTLPAREGDIVSFGVPPGDRTNDDGWNVTIAGAAAHATAEVDLFDERLSIEPGLRFELTLLDGDRVLPVRGREPEIGYTELEVTFDPRLRIAWRVLEELTFHGAAGIYHQPPDPADLSPVFGSPVLDLVTGVHSVLGARIDLFEKISIELTGFYVKLSHIPVRSSLPTPPQGAALVSSGEGRNYGGQLTLKSEIVSGLLGWISYSFSRAERRDGEERTWRLFDSDQTHNLSAVVSWQIGLGFDLGARFRYSSGFPRTPVLGSYYNARTGTHDPIYGEHNGIRLPDFIDLSLRLGYTHDFDWGKVEAFLDVQNVINRRNAEEILYTSDFSRSEIISGTPILPVLGARLEI